jgi:hypothetical protein
MTTSGYAVARRRTSRWSAAPTLADLGNSFEVLKDMRWVPFTVPTVLQLAATTLPPVLPLTFTMISLEDLLERLFKMMF